MSLILRRTKNRKYKEIGGRQEVVSPSEYAVYRGGAKLAAIVFNGDGWRACQPSENSKFGAAISPVGLDKFKAVKAWSFEYFGEKEKSMANQVNIFNCGISACGENGIFCGECSDKLRRIDELKGEIIELVTKFALSNPNIKSPLNIRALEIHNLLKGKSEVKK